jgi:hypothetical protein
MKRALFLPSILLATIVVCAPPVRAADRASEAGWNEANLETMVLDDMEDVSDWYNGSREETTLSAADHHVRVGQRALCFANLVDHTKGEEKYPVGWPRTGKDLKDNLPTDWTEWDFFECWIYTTTSRPTLPKTPLRVGFYHSGPKRSTHVRLDQVAKDQWVHVVIPTDDLMDPADVQRIQFNISESDYQHGDQIDFYIDQVALKRYVEPTIAEVRPERKLVFTTDRSLLVQYKLLGRRGLSDTQIELAAGHGEQTLATAATTATRQGELILRLVRSLPTGLGWVRLGLRGADRRLIDQQQVPVRVIPGPFEEELQP